MKTVLIQGVGWPEVGEWPTHYEHKEKPKRVIQKKPKAAAAKKAAAPKTPDIPKQNAKLKRPSLEPKEFFIFSRARREG